MNIFFFISFLVVTVSAVDKLHLQKLLNNPALFVSAFAHADGFVIAKMIKLVDDLILEGEDQRNDAIDNHNAKSETHNSDVRTLADAEDALSVASGNLNIATANRDSLVQLELSQRNSLNAATNARVAAGNLNDVTLDHQEATVARVATEKEMLEKVKVLLESVKSQGFRRLLSVDHADPGAVNAVISKVDLMLDTGAQEEADSIAAHDKAHAEHEAAKAVEDAASALHTETAGKLAAAENEVASLTAVKAAKTSDRDSAAAVESASRSALADALQNMNEEIARIDSEKATLEEVDALLKNILLS